RVTAAPSPGGSAIATLVVGGISGAFVVTTGGAGIDTTPDPFSFLPVSQAPLGVQINSNAVTITGINAPAPVTIVGGLSSVGGGAFTSAPGTVQAGQNIVVQVTSSQNNNTTQVATLNVGGVTGQFSVTTLSVVVDTTPDPFSYVPVNAVGP